jgi:serine/threonine-protein kinase
VLGAAFVVALAIWAPRRRAEAGSAVRLTADVGTDLPLSVNLASQGVLALSPDGKLLAFSAQTSAGTSQLYVRRLDQLRATPLAGTEEARSPFFSPDGRWIGFFTSTNLKKISISGGAPITICDARRDRGGTWGDGTIVFTPSGAPVRS